MPVLIGAIELKATAQTHPASGTQGEESLQISRWKSGFIHQSILAGQRLQRRELHCCDQDNIRTTSVTLQQQRFPGVRLNREPPGVQSFA